MEARVGACSAAHVADKLNKITVSLSGYLYCRTSAKRRYVLSTSFNGRPGSPIAKE